MHAAFITQFGDASVLIHQSVTPHTPHEGEVQLRITSAGLNRADILYREGKHYMRPKQFPARIGYEGAGIVTAAGPNTHANIGDRLALFPCGFDITTQGAFSETVTVPLTQTLPTPAHLDDIHAGACWMMYLTAAGALLPYLEKNNTVLISAASSSVGLAAIAVCRAVGAIPIALTTHVKHKREILLHAGSETVLDIADTQSFPQADIAFCAVSGPVINAYIKALKPGGKIIQYGLLDTTPWTPHVGLLIGKHLSIDYFNIAQLLEQHPRRHHTIAWLQSRLGTVLPITISQTFALDQIASAMDAMVSNQHIGKMIVTP